MNTFPEQDQQGSENNIQKPSNYSESESESSGHVVLSREQSSDSDSDSIDSDCEVEHVMDSFYSCTRPIKCSVCDKKHKDINMVIKICNRDHYAVPDCFKQYLENYIENRPTKFFKCPHNGCYQEVNTSAIDDINSQYPKDNLKKHFEELPPILDDIVTCPNPDCGISIDFKPNQNLNEDYKYEGKSLSHPEKIHFNKYFCRCSNCGTEFCTNCGAMPYHYHQTCEECNAKDNKCRFCHEILKSGKCNDPACAKSAKYICDEILPCGHHCNGVKGEKHHLRCLHPDCLKKDNIHIEDCCSICVYPMAGPPVVQLTCGHFFHYYCLKENMENAIKNKSTTFRALKCPLCNEDIDCPQLEETMKPLKDLQDQVAKLALMRLEYEGRNKDKELTDPNSEYYKNPKKYALHLYHYPICSKCNKLFFGGAYNCMPADNIPIEDRICGACSARKGDICKKHGTEGLMYKCRFCCNIAIWFCWGTTHFCEKCHRKASEMARKPISQLPKCPGHGKCPLGIDHPPNGTEFCLGCAKCMAENDKVF